MERFKGERLTVVLYQHPDAIGNVTEAEGDAPVGAAPGGGPGPVPGAPSSATQAPGGAPVGVARGPGPGSVPSARALDSDLVCDCCEPVLAVKKSYRAVGKREKQEELFPELQKEIAKKRVELYKGVRWPDDKARQSRDYLELSLIHI